MKKIILIMAAIGMLAANRAYANVTVTVANATVSADNAQNSTGGAVYTTLGNIVITEAAAGADFPIATGRTMTFAPANGWAFKAATGTVSAASGKDIDKNTITMTVATNLITVSSIDV